MDSSQREVIRRSILDKYKKYSQVQSAADFFRYITGKPGLDVLGYDKELTSRLPDEVVKLFCGVGNPFSLGNINKGEWVLDVGCGAGVDLILAGSLVGPEGKAHGIDITPEMVALAKKNIQFVGAENVEVTEGSSEKMPYTDGVFDVVISNGVINLSIDKEKTFKEIFRVLKPGGRLQFADIILESFLPEEELRCLNAWSD